MHLQCDINKMNDWVGLPCGNCRLMQGIRTVSRKLHFDKLTYKLHASVLESTETDLEIELSYRLYTEIRRSTK